MRHLHYDRKAEPAALCGVWARKTVHYSKARRTDCASCRKIHRARVWSDRADTIRREPPAAPVVLLSVRPPDGAPRRSFLVGEIRLAVAKFGGNRLADLILGHLQAGPQLPGFLPGGRIDDPEPCTATVHNFHHEAGDGDFCLCGADTWETPPPPSRRAPCTPFLHQFDVGAEGSDPCRCGEITYRGRP